MNTWINTLAELVEQNEPCILVTVAAVRGSAPREVGAKMIVTAAQTIGTIGGGQLEYQCTRIACEKIARAYIEHPPVVRRFPLGANCGQCCGGVVEILFETIGADSAQWLNTLQSRYAQRRATVIASSLTGSECKFLITAIGHDAPKGAPDCPQSILSAARSLLLSGKPATEEGEYLLEPVRESSLNIAIFGAGHVGTAVVDALSHIEGNIHWIDNRRNMFPEDLPVSLTVLESADPAAEVAAMPPGSYYLVLTHSHPLDLEICSRVLQREDFAYCGLIGSVSKRRRFERQLRKQGVTEASLQRIICPIGVSGITGKKPAEIALAVAAEILQTRDALQDAHEFGNTDATNIVVM